MEILGDGDRGRHRSSSRDAPPDVVDLDEPVTRLSAPEGRGAGRGGRIGAVASPEALGVAGLFCALVATTQLPQVVLQLLWTMNPSDERFTRPVGALAEVMLPPAGLALLLGAIGVWRLTPRDGAAARALAGGATLVGLVFVALLVAAAVLVETPSLTDL